MDQRKVIYLSYFLFFVLNLSAQPSTTDNLDLVAIGKQFLGKPYRAHILSSGNPEQLITSQDGFDCVTFLEHCLALRIAKGQADQFKDALIHVRYAGDSIQYEKRYHYFSDAMQHLGFEMIQDSLHRRIAPKDFRFLSTFLKSRGASSIQIPLLEQREQMLRTLPFLYTAKQDIAHLIPRIQDGDLIALVGKSNHIDFLHTAMAVRKGAQVYLLHASQEEKQVLISDQSLIDYLKSHHQFIGISVFRPKFNI